MTHALVLQPTGLPDRRRRWGEVCGGGRTKVRLATECNECKRLNDHGWHPLERNQLSRESTQTANRLELLQDLQSGKRAIGPTGKNTVLSDCNRVQRSIRNGTPNLACCIADLAACWPDA